MDILREILPMLPLPWGVNILREIRQKAQKDIDSVYLQKEILQERYDALLQSTSWKITAPLRKIMSI